MKYPLFLCVLLLTLIVSAQPNSTLDIRTGSISGRVLDAKLKEPLPYVNIIIKDVVDKIITGGITDKKGRFNISNIPEGAIKIEIKFIGYKTIQKQDIIGKGNYDITLEDLFLSEDVTSLDEISIVAEVSTIQQKVDRKVITIGKDLTTSGPTASDIMNNLPAVSVDQQTGDIALRGNQNVQVMVDGKLSNIPAAQLLKQIPSNSIKQIELITNPSAKYNPEGLSGIINIILHKNTLIGFNGNLNVGLAYQDNSKFNSALDLNYRNGKFNFFGNYSNTINKNQNYGNINRTLDQSLQLFRFLDKGKSHLFKVGVDFYLNDRNTISVFTNQNSFNGNTSGQTDVIFNTMPNDNLFQNFGNENENDSQQYNFDYKLEFKKQGHNIELEVDHNIYDANVDTNNRFTGTSARPNFIENTATERSRTTINLDYVNPLPNNTKLEFGLQARLFESNIDYASDARERDRLGNYGPTVTDFDYTRNIYSAYITYGKKLEKWSYQMGLRAENVDVNSDAYKRFETLNEALNTPFENDYFQVYPSLFLSYTPSEKNAYQLSYSRRVDRPGIGQVNPLPEWNTPLISSFGKQDLEPQFTNSIEVNYTRQLEKGSITAGVFYRLIEDEISRAVFIDRTTLGQAPELTGAILTFDNFSNTSAYGVEVSSNYKPAKWWSLNGSFDLYSQTQKSFTEVLSLSATDPTSENDISNQNISVDNVVWNIRLFNNFKVSKKLSFSVFGLYRGQNKGIQFTQKPFTFVNLGMRYNFLEDNRATFNLNFNDIFNTMQFKFEGDRPFPSFGDFNWESRTIFAGLSYRFGGGKFRAKSRKRRDNDEKSGGGGFM